MAETYHGTTERPSECVPWDTSEKCKELKREVEKLSPQEMLKNQLQKAAESLQKEIEGAGKASEDRRKERGKLTIATVGEGCFSLTSFWITTPFELSGNFATLHAGNGQLFEISSLENPPHKAILREINKINLALAAAKHSGSTKDSPFERSFDNVKLDRKFRPTRRTIWQIGAPLSQNLSLIHTLKETVVDATAYLNARVRDARQGLSDSKEEKRFLAQTEEALNPAGHTEFKRIADDYFREMSALHESWKLRWKKIESSYDLPEKKTENLRNNDAWLDAGMLKVRNDALLARQLALKNPTNLKPGFAQTHE